LLLSLFCLLREFLRPALRRLIIAVGITGINGRLRIITGTGRPRTRIKIL
jgi:hypothetical protein